MNLLEQSLYLNGLDAATGRPLVDPVSHGDLAKRVLDVYAAAVVDQEAGRSPAVAKRVVFFAPRHDPATTYSAHRLVRPIRKQLPDSVPADVSFHDLIGEEATKQKLVAALSDDQVGQTPAILFSASHGAGVPSQDPDQRALQGAIVCQDHQPPLTIQQRCGFVSGHDVTEGFCLPGGIHFCVACYGAGTRSRSDFIRYRPTDANRKALRDYQAAEDFGAFLPQALLAHPQRGALAVVGHVDPAWVHGFTSVMTGERRIHPFGFTLARLLRGAPVGFAVAAFSQKYANLSTDLLSMIEDQEASGEVPDAAELSDLWICRNDAQNYVILGDPAARLRFALWD